MLDLCTVHDKALCLQLLSDQIKAGQEHSKEVTLELTLAAYTRWVMVTLQDMIPQACRQMLLEEVGPFLLLSLSASIA